MTNRETMELFIEKNGQETVAYPFVEKDHVVFGNGMGIEEVIEQDISMPTVTHEEVSFKVGVGDQDVSSAIVDSSVSEMTIKGKTYQNILPEPSTHVLTNNKEMFKVNEGLDPNVEIVDGVSKSAILSGNTLVNISIIKEYSFSSTQIQIKCYNNEMIKTNTEYTVIYDITDTNDLGSVMLDCFGNTPLPITLGSHKIKFRTLTSLKNNSNMYISGGFVGVVDNIMIIEGDYTNQDIPYFEGMQSVKLPVLTTTNGSAKILTDAQLNDKTGEIEPHNNSNKVIEDYILIPNNTVVVSNVSWLKISFYGANKNFISNTGSNNINKFELNDTTIPNNAKYFRLHYNAVTLPLIRFADGTDYIKATIDGEPFKTNILTVNEEVELRGVGDVQDTLDLMTGEVTQRIGEIVLNGSESWMAQPDTNWNTDTHISFRFIANDMSTNMWAGGKTNCISDKFKTITLDNESYKTSDEFIGSDGHPDTVYFNIKISRSRLNGDETVNGLKQWLSQNPITLQYKVKTESIKTVDLSSSGNWEKIVLDGSEDWTTTNDAQNQNSTMFFRLVVPNILPTNVTSEKGNLWSDTFVTTPSGLTTGTWGLDTEAISVNTLKALDIRILKSKLPTQDVAGFKTWLSENPVTVWYQTTTHQDSTQVKQPIFFKDGHVVQSSGADNSLIPTLNYQAKTSNSYVMDLMKTNTKYTMKAKSASGTFTIDGTSYGAGTNGTFTTPTSMTNKFLVMSDKTHEEVMIIEGDVTDKTIPYFKGIKSAFEGEDKIEVLSTGKNLTHHILGGNPESKEYNFMNIIETHKNTSGALNRAKVIKWVEKDKFFIKGYGIDQYDNQYNIDLTPTVLKPNTTYFISFESIEGSHEQQEDMKLTLGTFNVWLNNTRVIRAYEGGTYTFTTPSQVDSFNLNLWLDGTKNKNATIYAIFNKFMITEGKSIDEGYEPHKSNTTKIPLLSPLRSLPNGVCDELIINRMKKKATLIQRIKSTVFNGSESWNLNNYSHDKLVEFVCHGGVQMAHTIFSDRFITGGDNVERVAFSGDSIYIRISKTKVGDVNSFKQWLSQNPLTVQYGLNTPVVTEVDLDNFPFVYKDGHIFLNSKIAPTTQITYSISQQHQIDASTQDLIRHEQELVYLYKLIAQYIQVDYQSTLLSLDLKLK